MSSRETMTGRGGLSFQPVVSRIAFVLLSVAAAGSHAQAQVPMISAAGVVDAATFRTDSVTPGSLVSIFGIALADGTAAATIPPLPRILANSQVTFNGLPAPLIYVSPGQINAQVPWELTGSRQATLQVTRGSSTSSPVAVSLAEFGPAVFTTNQRGTGQGAVLISSDNTLAAAQGVTESSRPITVGEYISIYCLGLGPVSNQPETGQPSNVSPLAMTVRQPEVTVGGVDADVVFAGLAPTYVGLYQVNVRIPVSLPTSNFTPLVVSIGGASSRMVTVAVRNPSPVPLQVVELHPPQGSTGISVSGPFSATFNKDLATTSLQPLSFRLLRGDRQLLATVGYDPVSRRAALLPEAMLDPEEQYTLVLESEISDTEGLKLGQRVSWSFVTAPAPVITGRLVAPPGTNPQQITAVTLGTVTSVDANGTFQFQPRPQGVTLIAAPFPDRPFGYLATAVNAGDTASAASLPPQELARTRTTEPRVTKWQTTASEASSSGELIIDKQTTAETLLFLSPVLYTPDPTRAQAIQRVIATHPATRNLALTIEAFAGLPDPLQDPRLESAYRAALNSVVADVLQNYTLAALSTTALQSPDSRDTRTVQPLSLSQSLSNPSAVVSWIDTRVLDTDFVTPETHPAGSNFLIAPTLSPLHAVGWLIDIRELAPVSVRDDIAPTLQKLAYSPGLYQILPACPTQPSPEEGQRCGVRKSFYLPSNSIFKFFSIDAIAKWVQNAAVNAITGPGNATIVSGTSNTKRAYVMRAFSGGKKGYPDEFNQMQQDALLTGLGQYADKVRDNGDLARDAHILNYVEVLMQAAQIIMPSAATESLGNCAAFNGFMSGIGGLTDRNVGVLDILGIGLDVLRACVAEPQRNVIGMVNKASGASDDALNAVMNEAAKGVGRVISSFAAVGLVAQKMIEQTFFATPVESALFIVDPSPVMTGANGISVAPRESRIGLPNGWVELVGQVTDSSGHVVSNPISWTSSDESVARVDGKGLVRAVGKGEALICASASGTGLSGSSGTATPMIQAYATVAVGEAAVDSVVVYPREVSVQRGQSVPLRAWAVDSDWNTVVGKSVLWLSDSPLVAAIDAVGNVTGVSAGRTSVWANIEGKTASATIDVLPPVVDRISISPGTAVVGVGGAQQFHPTAIDRDGNAIGGVSFTWGSSDDTIASVSNLGLATGTRTGVAQIRASADGKSATSELRVGSTLALTVQLRNVTGRSDPVAGAAEVRLFQGDGTRPLVTLPSNASSQVPFTGLAPGPYRYEVYHLPGGFGTSEFWGRADTDLRTDSTVVFTRRQPYVGQVVFTDTSDNREVKKDSTVGCNTQVRAQVPVISPAGGDSGTVTVELVLDRDRLGSYDISVSDCGGAASLTSGGTRTLSCTFNPTSPGTYSFGSILRTSGTQTDTGEWQTTFTVAACPAVTADIVSKSVSSKAPPVNQAMTISLTGKNTGTTTWTYGFGVSVRRPDGVTIDNVALKAVTLAGGATSSTQTFDYTPTVAGCHDVRYSIWKEPTTPPSTRLADSGWVSCSFTVPPSPGTLTVTVNNMAGGLVLPATGNGTVLLYSGTSASGTVLQTKYTDANRQVTFSNLSNGTYTYAVYHMAGAFGTTEYWGARTVTVSGSGSDTFTRNMPHVSGVAFYNGATNVTGGTVASGTALQGRITVTNPGGGSGLVSGRLILDRDTASSYDLDQACGSQSITTGTTQATLTCTVTLTVAGTY